MIDPTPDPEFRIIRLPPDEAKPHLAVIFEELGARTFRERLAVARKLYSTVAEYGMGAREAARHWSAEAAWRWHKAVVGHAKGIVDLLENAPDLDKPERLDDLSRLAHRREELREGVFPPHDSTLEFFRRLRTVASHDLTRKGRRKGRRRDYDLPSFLDEMGKLYHAATGNQSRASRPGTGGPADGPFIRVMVAACALAGEPKTPDAIATALRRLKGNKTTPLPA